MNTNRRQFIQTVAGLASQAIALTSLYGQNRLNPGTPYAKAGVVIAIEGRTIYASNSKGPIVVRVPTDTIIWNGERGASIGTIHSGDRIVTRGVDDPTTGDYVASDIWVNIVNIEGVIASVSGDAIVVKSLLSGATSPATQVSITDRTFSARDIPLNKQLIKIGRGVQVIGLALPDGTIRATRIFISENGQPIEPEETPIMDPYTGKLIPPK